MFAVVDRPEDLFLHQEEILAAMRNMLRRTGYHGQTPEKIIKAMFEYVNSVDGFHLWYLDDNEKIQGLLFAIHVPDAVESDVHVIALWSRPGVASKIKDEGIELLNKWAKTRGAKKIYTIITRTPEKFFRFFHETIGFKKVGYLLEREVL